MPETDWPTAKEIYKNGQKYSITSTIIDDFIPKYGKGSKIYGTMASTGLEGWFLDFASGYACNALGYKNKMFEEAIIDQIRTGILHIPSCDWHTEKAVALKKKLCEIAPIRGRKKVFLSNSGTEAIEAAIKFCEARRFRELKSYTARNTFLAFQGSFNGRTLGSLSFNASKPEHTTGFSRALNVIHWPFPDLCDQQSINDFGAAVENCRFFDRINAVFLELVQGEGGIRAIDYRSLNRLVKICRDHDIYIVVDEIQTGMMRSGEMFACEEYEIRPDIICLGKALAGGFPIGAVVANAAFDLAPGQHSNTFGGNPVICNVSLALIEQLENLDKRELKKKIKFLSAFAPQGLGMMRKIDLLVKKRRDEVRKKAMQNGLIVIPAGESAIRLMPPLNISMEDLKEGLQILKKSMV